MRHGDRTRDFMAKALQAVKQLNILDAYSSEMPDHQVAFDLFKGEWSSAVPGYATGHIGLFQDSRDHLVWRVLRRGFAGKSILELGPLEAGHTFMLAQSGAARILSIESNQRAYLKCLIVQQALKFAAEFKLGDFQPYLARADESFDFALCSGVLYHMTDPVAFLTNVSRVSKSIGIWTHYFDEKIIASTGYLTHKFAKTPKLVETGRRTMRLYKQSYKQALDWRGFCGGPEIMSYWLPKEDIVGHLEDQGFTVTIGNDEPAHSNGPSMLLYAQKA